MPNIATILKSEITRIARKEIRAEVEGLKKSVNGYRSEIATLKRRAQSMEQQIKRLEKSAPKSDAPPSVETGKTPRFSAKGLAKQRQRLELSADAVGVLIGASGQSVYNWEAGKAATPSRSPDGDRGAAYAEQEAGGRDPGRSEDLEVDESLSAGLDFLATGSRDSRPFRARRSPLPGGHRMRVGPTGQAFAARDDLHRLDLRVGEIAGVGPGYP